MNPSLHSGNIPALSAEGKRTISKSGDLRGRRLFHERCVLISFGILFYLALLTSTAWAQSQTPPSYRIEPLPLFPKDVNDTGQVAGCDEPVFGTTRAVLYSGGNVTDLGAGPGSCATAINNKGDVAGYNGAGHLFLWTASSATLQDLGLPPHLQTSYGIALGGMNDAGQIAGSAFLGLYGDYTEGFIWQPGQMAQPGSWNELQPDSANGVLSIFLTAINDLGDVAGQLTSFSQYVGAVNLGYIRTHDGTVTLIRPDPRFQACGRQVPGVNPASINDSLEVVGMHDGSNCNLSDEFVWTPSGGLQPGGWGFSQYFGSYATGVTNDGRVLDNFFAINSSGRTTDGDFGGYSLTQLVRADCGWTHISGDRISRNMGNIIGRGVNPTISQFNTNFLMTLLSSPPQTMADGCTVPPANPKPTSVPHVSQPVVEAAGPNGASVTLDGSGSTAPNGGALAYSWSGPFGTTSGVSPTVILPLGTSTITLTVTDTLGHTGSATIQITVQDTTPPVLTLPLNPSLQATSVSGAAVTFSPSANDLVSGAAPVNCTPASGSTFAIGTTTVNCSATDAASNTATGSFTVTVTRLSQTISFGPLPNHTYGDADFPLSATSSSGLPLIYTTAASNPYCMLIGFTVHIISAGICPITAQQAGNGNYLPAADVTQSLTIAQATQTISFGPLPNHTYGEADFPLSASASSGLPVTFTVPASNPYCMLIGPVVHIITAGICPITAQQAGNGNYLAAANVTQPFTINRAPLTITANNATRQYGQANPSFGGSYSAFVNGESASVLTGMLNCTSVATPTSPVNGGPYPITCTGQTSSNYGITYVPGGLTISPTPLTITANGATKILNAPLPVLGGSYSAFVSGENSSVLAGTLNCAAAATATSAVGSYPISCSGQTSSNYAITYVPSTLKVIYAPAGVCGHMILPPINADGSLVGKQGRTIPAKFQVCEANGVSIGTPGVVTSFFLTQIITGTVTTNVQDIVDANNPDTAFRWDGQEWIFNITTQNLAAGSTYVYTISLNDGSAIMFQFGLR